MSNCPKHIYYDLNAKLQCTVGLIFIFIIQSCNPYDSFTSKDVLVDSGYTKRLYDEAFLSPNQTKQATPTYSFFLPQKDTNKHILPIIKSFASIDSNVSLNLQKPLKKFKIKNKSSNNLHASSSNLLTEATTNPRDTTQQILPTVASSISALKKDSIPVLKKAQQLNLRIESDTTWAVFEEVKTENDSANNNKLAKDEKNTTANTGQLVENTGSSYFTSEVNANLNDQINSKYTTKLLYDSIKTTNNKEFAYNTITLNNVTNEPLSIQVVITSPKSWQMLTTNLSNITIDPFSSSIIPIRLSPAGNGNTSVWQDVRIEFRLNNQTDSRKAYFRIKVQEYSSFKASLPNNNIVLTGYQRTVSIPIFIRNAGNTLGKYTTQINNEFLGINEKILTTIEAGKDSMLMFSFPISESKYNGLKKEEVKILVKNEKDETYSMIQNIAKVGYLVKDHGSAFLDMPLQLEMGVMYQGSQSPIQYYGAVNGNIDIDEQNKFSFAYRSNTFAKGQTNNNSLARIDYKGEKWSAGIGNIQGVGEFLVDGYGARVGYQWKGVNKFEAYNMFKSRNGDNKIVGLALQTGLKNWARINESFSLNMDQVKRTNSSIMNQIIELKNEQGKLSLISGLGFEHNNNFLVAGTKNTLVGSSFGYNITYVNKWLNANSNVLYNSNSYPGVFKGQRIQMHDVRLTYKRVFLGSFFEYNYRIQNYFQDSTLFENVFNLKTTNLGGRIGYQYKKGSVTLALGNQKQMQATSESVSTNYDYVNLMYSTMIAKRIYINLVSFAGIMSVSNGGENQSAFVTSNQGTIQYKLLGSSFRIDNGPYYYQEFLSYLVKNQQYQRIMISPFAEIKLWRQALNGRFQGNYATTYPAKTSTANLIANINYAHPTKGFDFNLNAIFPFNNSAGVNNNPYMNMSFRMRLKAPFVPIRKFYTLKVILFKDNNSNGEKDADEEPISGQKVSLNSDMFVTDKNGLIVYKNTEPGMYKADFGHSTLLKGWIPSEGNAQTFQLNSNRTVYVPYKVSRVLVGKLNVQKDQLSDLPFNPANIRVTVTAEKGEVNSTLTDENGEFHFNLPAGKYIVSLSESAFGDQFKPVSFSQPADLVNNQTVNLYFEIKQKRRAINIKKKD